MIPLNVRDIGASEIRITPFNWIWKNGKSLFWRLIVMMMMHYSDSQRTGLCNSCSDVS